jgi:hypothetical protein
MSDLTLKQEIKKFIPVIENMFVREIEHRNYILENKKKHKNNFFHKDVGILMDKFLKETEKMIKHLTLRLKEYKEYCKDV